MIYSLKISEKYDIEICLYFYQCAIDARLEAEALAQLEWLGRIFQKAIAAGRLDDESTEIISFVAEYPDLLQKAKKFGVGLDDLVMKACGQKPYGADVAETIRMTYIH